MSCCERPNINRMDHHIHGEEPYLVVNRICLNCGAHWYGKDGEVREYTRKEWDDFVSEVHP